MKWWLTLIVLVALQCTLIAQTRTYTVKDLYEIDVPAAWQESGTNPSPVFTFSQNGKLALHFSITTVEDPFSDLDDFYTRTVTVDIPGSFKDLQFQANGVETINQVRFRWLEYTMKQTIATANITYMTRVQDKLFAIQVTAPIDRFGELKPTILKTIRSFRAPNFSAKLCYSITYGEADSLPRPLFSLESLSHHIEKEIILPDSVKDRRIDVGFMFNVNCKGESFNFSVPFTPAADGTITRSPYAQAFRKLYPLFRQKMRFRPGWNKGYYVDFAKFMDLTIYRGMVEITVR